MVYLKKENQGHLRKPTYIMRILTFISFYLTKIKSFPIYEQQSVTNMMEEDTILKGNWKYKFKRKCTKLI